MIMITALRKMWLSDDKKIYRLFDKLEDFVSSQLVSYPEAPENPDHPENHYTIIKRDQLEQIIDCCAMYAARQDEDDEDEELTGDMEELMEIMNLPEEERWEAIAGSNVFECAFGELDYVNKDELKYWAGEY